MRICWVHPTTRTETLEPLWARLDQIVRPALRDDVELEHRFLDRSGNFTRSLYAEHLNSVHMVEAALRAQDEGFDGVFLGCWNDPLWEAREVLDIPVASVGEQSMLAALAVGRRFAIVTVSEKTVSAIDDDLRGYGLCERAIVRPVRSISPESDAALLLESTSADRPSDFIRRLEQVAGGCIADGADTLLVGCAYYGPLLRAAGYDNVAGTRVAVVDTTTVALKYLEAMVDIASATGLVKSQHRYFRTPPRQALDRARGSLTGAPPSFS